MQIPSSLHLQPVRTMFPDQHLHLLSPTSPGPYPFPSGTEPEYLCPRAESPSNGQGAYQLSSNPPNPRSAFRNGDWMYVSYCFLFLFSPLFSLFSTCPSPSSRILPSSPQSPEEDPNEAHTSSCVISGPSRDIGLDLNPEFVLLVMSVPFWVKRERRDRAGDFRSDGFSISKIPCMVFFSALFSERVDLQSHRAPGGRGRCLVARVSLPIHLPRYFVFIATGLDVADA